MIKYRVTYECVEDSLNWGQTGSINTIVFDTYSLVRFREAAPSNWQIRKIDPITEVEAVPSVPMSPIDRDILGAKNFPFLEDVLYG